MRPMRRVVWVIVLGVLSGCYIYRPLGTAQPSIGTRVAAELTDRGSDTLTREVGPGITILRGDVVDAADAAVVLSVTSVMDRSGRDQSWKRERVRVPRIAVQNFQRREFSLGRSLLLGAAFLGGSVVAWEAFQGGIRGGGILPGGGGGAPK
jgi:hypothetical protein